jgi:hypothetical protein
MVKVTKETKGRAGNEKRREVRVPVDLWIEVDREGELYFQRASNLSVGGAYFTQTIPLPLATHVSLKFELPLTGAQVRCRGEIVTAKELGMGVHFLELSQDDQARLGQVVAELATRNEGRS